MRHVLLKIHEESEHGTVSRLYIDGKFFCYSMEPPWRDNKPDLSCIPEGERRCVWHHSPRYGWVYLVTDVEGRTWVLFHWGNFGGDRKKGYRTDTLACILLGRKLGYLKVNGRMQRSVLISRPTVRKFFDVMGQEDFMLTIDRGGDTLRRAA